MQDLPPFHLAFPVASSTSITAPERRMSFFAVSNARGVCDRNFSMMRSRANPITPSYAPVMPASER